LSGGLYPEHPPYRTGVVVPSDEQESRPARQLRRSISLGAQILGWAVAAGLLLAAGLRLAHLDLWAPAAALQSAAPTYFLLAYPLVLGAALARRVRLLAVAAVLLACQLWWFGSLLPVVHRSQASRPGETRVRVLSANLLAENRQAVDLAGAITREAPDIVALQEYTWRNGGALGDAPALGAYPYRLLAPTWSPDGIALFSRWPLSDQQTVVLAGRQALRATALTPAGPIVVVVAHTVAPVDGSSTRAWADQLRAIADFAAKVDGPLVIAADLNATPGNRQYAALTDRARVRDVLAATGSGYAMTWPANRRLLPPLVRPDHILVGRGVVPLRGHTITDPGSDHRAVVADVGLSPPR